MIVVSLELNQKLMIMNSQQMEEVGVYKYQVAGKLPKFEDIEKRFIFKIYSQVEANMYLRIQNACTTSPEYSLKAFVPKFYGITTKKISQATHSQPGESQKANQTGNQSKRQFWIEHIVSRANEEISKEHTSSFIKLENITHGYHFPNIIDLKLGTKKDKKSNVKFQKTTTNSHKFRINGLIVELYDNQKYEECFLSKYYGQNIIQKDMLVHLSLFFFDGKSIDTHLISKMLILIKQMVFSVQKIKDIKFMSSSLFLTYDSRDHSKYSVNLIDFDKYCEVGQPDISVATGLINIHHFLLQVIEKASTLQIQLKNRDLDCFKVDYDAVPKSRIDKQQGKKQKKQKKNKEIVSKMQCIEQLHKKNPQNIQRYENGCN